MGLWDFILFNSNAVFFQVLADIMTSSIIKDGRARARVGHHPRMLSWDCSKIAVVSLLSQLLP